jgi:hypothetical protein
MATKAAFWLLLELQLAAAVRMCTRPATALSNEIDSAVKCLHLKRVCVDEGHSYVLHDLPEVTLPMHALLACISTLLCYFYMQDAPLPVLPEEFGQVRAGWQIRFVRSALCTLQSRPYTA